MRIISRIECLVTGMAVILAPGAKSFPVLTQDPSSGHFVYLTELKEKKTSQSKTIEKNKDIKKGKLLK